MQTFLISPSFVESAGALDVRRLGKQRVETYQILRVLVGITVGWQNHPAVKMWRGYEHGLLNYGRAICLTWREKGYKDTVLDKLNGMEALEPIKKSLWQNPAWLGNDAFHISHKSNLLRKDKAFYSQFNWNIPDNLPYIWPV